MPTRLLVLGLVLLPLLARADARDVVFADFEGQTYGDWTTTGDAFGSGPAQGTLPNQMPVNGFKGHSLVNSFNGGDKSTGTLTSPSFTITHRYIAFLIGGGGYEGKTCINLLIDGKVARSATGPNTKPGGSEELAPSGWDVGDLKGRTATLQIVDDATGGWGHINVDQIVFTDKRPPIATRVLSDVTSNVMVEHRYLWFPIKSRATGRRVTVIVDGKVERYFTAELADGEAEWWSPLDLSAWKGKRLTIKVDRLPEDSKALASLHQTDEWEHADQLYHEALRPQFHFTPKRGWLNDPNGLVFYNGEHHAFFQHSPFSFGGGVKMWGHAVSKDLVHWDELPDEALWADELGEMYSGSAVVDRENTSGFGSADKPPLVLIYTAAGKPFTQCIAYSTDGRHFTKYEKNPVVLNVSPGNRDPKVIWYAPTKRWVMTFYAGLSTKEGGKSSERHTVQFYTSPNLRDWTKVSQTDGGSGDDHFLFECPDFFPLALDGDASKTKWWLGGADAEYALGSFDGTTFTPDGAKIGPRSRGYYAAQTFSDEPTGRRIQMPWLQPSFPGMPFNQCLGVPVELTLRTTTEGPRLYRWPVKELERLRKQPQTLATGAIKAGENALASVRVPELMELELAISPGEAKAITLNLRGLVVAYDVAKQELVENKHVHAAPLVKGELHLRVLFDRAVTELFASDGLTYVSVGVVPQSQDAGLSLTVDGGAAQIRSGTVYELTSSWK